MWKSYLKFCQTSHILWSEHHNCYFSGPLSGQNCKCRFVIPVKVDRAWSAGISKLGNLSFFDDGWGTPSELRLFRNKIQLIKSLDITKYTAECQKSIRLDQKKVCADFVTIDGSYVSPVNKVFQNERIWPVECHNGTFQMILPRDKPIKGIVIQTAGTGRRFDHRKIKFLVASGKSSFSKSSCISVT